MTALEIVAEGLVYSHDSMPGIVRRGTRRFRYVTTDDKPVKDAVSLERIKALAVPPAWTDVWICADEQGHLQATGRDAKGRKQSRYHPAFRAERESDKFGRLPAFGHALGDLRTQVARDLVDRAPTARRQTALVVHLLDVTAIRVGNERYVKENGSFGLSTLRSRQARVNGADITFRFVGKSGRRHTVTLNDRRLARLVAQCQDLPGQTLFTFVGEDGDVHPIGSSQVNDYIREATGGDFTAKTFRTWTATAQVATDLARATGSQPTKKQLLAAVDDAAARLGNTRSVCRNSYVHPSVEQTYLDGTLAEIWIAGPRRPTAGLSTDERRTLHLLTTSETPRSE